MGINQKIDNPVKSSPINSQPDHLVFIINKLGEIESWNDSSEIILGYEQDEIIGKHVGLIIKSDDLEKLTLQSSHSGYASNTVQLKKHNDTLINATVSLNAMLDKQDQVMGFLILIKNISEVTATTENKEKETPAQSSNNDCEEQLEHLKKEFELFSYSMSHDLNAPLRAIEGYVKLIEESLENQPDSETIECISHIQQNVKKMSSLIGNLLTLSRIATRELKMSEINMQELVHEVVTELSKQYDYKSKIVINHLHPITADYSLMNLVFFHLASNAIKFSSKTNAPIVEIFSEKNHDKITYVVRDNGIGLDVSKADKLFITFQKLHHLDDLEGTGMGLMIVKRIIDKHNGNVGVKSEPGKGAEFHFSLPINKP